MKATLCDHDDNRIEVDIDYYMERESGYYVITECVILSEIPKGFLCSDIQTDIEESIAIHERVNDVRLKCGVEFGRNQWQRIADLNPGCKLMRVA